MEPCHCEQNLWPDSSKTSMEYDHSSEHVTGRESVMAVENIETKRDGSIAGHPNLYIDPNGFVRAKHPDILIQAENKEESISEEILNGQNEEMNSSDSDSDGRTRNEDVEHHPKQDQPISEMNMNNRNMNEQTEINGEHIKQEKRSSHLQCSQMKITRNVSEDEYHQNPKEYSAHSNSDRYEYKLKRKVSTQGSKSSHNSSVEYSFSCSAEPHNSPVPTLANDFNVGVPNIGCADQKCTTSNVNEPSSSISYLESEEYETSSDEEEITPKKIVRTVSWTRTSWRRLSRSLSGRENASHQEIKALERANSDKKAPLPEPKEDKGRRVALFRNMFGDLLSRGSEEAKKVEKNPNNYNIRENKKNKENEMTKKEEKDKGRIDFSIFKKDQMKMATRRRESPRGRRRKRKEIVTYPNEVVVSKKEGEYSTVRKVQQNEIPFDASNQPKKSENGSREEKSNGNIVRTQYAAQERKFTEKNFEKSKTNEKDNDQVSVPWRSIHEAMSVDKCREVAEDLRNSARKMDIELYEPKLAIPLFQQALDIRTKAGLDDTKSHGKIQFQYAVALLKIGRIYKAYEIIQASEEIGFLSFDHPVDEDISVVGRIY